MNDRSERALTAAVIIWAVGVSVVATLAPEPLATFLISRAPTTVAGTIMLTIGLLGALAHGTLVAAASYTSHDTPLVEEVDR